MKPVVELNELMERIRRAADEENRVNTTDPDTSGYASDLSPFSGPLPQFFTSALTADMLDQARQMLPSAHRKNAVPKGVPKLLRPLFRNQGGLNGVLLAIIERLVGVNREFAEQLSLSRGKMDAIEQESAQNRVWASAVDRRLESFKDERLLQLEVRLDRLEQKIGADADRERNFPLRPPSVPAQIADRSRLEAWLTEWSTHLETIETDRSKLGALVDQVRAQLAEQLDYIRSVHGHLDKLGVHVEEGFARLTRQAGLLQEQMNRLDEQLRRLPAPTDAG